MGGSALGAIRPNLLLKWALNSGKMLSKAFVIWTNEFDLASIKLFLVLVSDFNSLVW